MTNVKPHEGVGRHAKTLPVTETAAMATEETQQYATSESVR